MVAVIDLEVISAAVDMAIDRFLPSRKSSKGASANHANDITARIDVLGPEMDGDEDSTATTAAVEQKKDMIKDHVTTVVGAILQKQQCWERTVCTVGKRARDFAAKDLVFL